MYIIESVQFKFKTEFNKYFPCSSLSSQYSILYVGLFFFDGISYIYRAGVADFIQELKTRHEEKISFEMIELTMDNKSNIVYFSELFDNSIKEVTSEIHQLIESDNIIELCHRKFLNYTTMTQENLYYLLLTWENLIDKGAPFVLIYLDDKDWYDSLPFDSKEVMEKFVADHTKQEAL